jgi:hypothetical protein
MTMNTQIGQQRGPDEKTNEQDSGQEKSDDEKTWSEQWEPIFEGREGSQPNDFDRR